MRESMLMLVPPSARGGASRRQSRYSGAGHLSGDRVAVALVLMLVLLVGLTGPTGAQRALPAPSTRDSAAPLVQGESPRLAGGRAPGDGLSLSAGLGETGAPKTGTQVSALQTEWKTFQQGVYPTPAYSGVADTYISSEGETTNYGTALDLKIAYDNRNRILLRFDLAGDIPQWAQVASARLELYAYRSEYPSASTDVGVYEVLRPWTENGATWTEAVAGNYWQQAGCSGPNDRSGLIAVTQFTAAGNWQVWSGTPFTELVQRWVSDPDHNYGMILLGSTADQPLQNWNLYSSQGPDKDNYYRPKLTVSYDLPEPTATPTITPTPTNTPVPSITPLPSHTPTATAVVTTATVSGVAWQDDNNNHGRDLNEPLMNGVTVILRNYSQMELARQTTLDGGKYRFAGLLEGNYLLTAEDPLGYTSTWPPGGTYLLYLASGETEERNFGFALLSTATPVATWTNTPTRTPTGTAINTPTRTVTPTPTATPAGSFQDPIPIVCQQTYSGSTEGRPSVINSYPGCTAYGMWGSEAVYRFQADYALNSLGISITAGDLYLFVLSSADPATCVQWGSSVGVSSIAAGVTYYIVVDGSKSGSYTMQVSCYPPPVTTPTLTPIHTATPTTGPSPTPSVTRTPGGPLTIYLPIVSKPRLEFLVDCGANTAYIDGTGQLWQADKEYTGAGWGYVGYSDTWSTGHDIVVGTPSTMRLYQTVRYGYAFGYQFAVPNGAYDVELHFAEIFHDQAGRRVFDVILEGQTVLSHFDILDTAGGRFQSYVESFPITVRDGQLDVVFDSIVDLAMINAIKVSG